MAAAKLRDLVVAVRDAMDAIEGSPKALQVQAEALLRMDGITFTDDDRRTIRRLIENHL